jgi:hypothetical protein
VLGKRGEYGIDGNAERLGDLLHMFVAKNASQLFSGNRDLSLFLSSHEAT